MFIYEVTDDRKKYLDLLLLADEQEDMIDLYLEKGTMFVLDDGGVKGECVVTDEGDGILEIKNIATAPDAHGKGYGRALIEFVISKYSDTYNILQVGTGDSPLTVPFYEKCGFRRHHVVKNFFTEHYDHPIYEEGVLLVDMIYLRRDFRKEEFIELDESYLPKMAELYRDSFKGEPWNDDWSDDLQLSEYIKEISCAYHCLNYGLIIDGNLVAMSLGMVRHWWEGTNYNIEELCVSPEFQGKGLGTRFMGLIEEDTRKKGCVGIFLQTDSDKPSFRFYHKLGFKDLGEHVSLYKSLKGEDGNGRLYHT